MRTHTATNGAARTVNINVTTSTNQSLPLPTRLPNSVINGSLMTSSGAHAQEDPSALTRVPSSGVLLNYGYHSSIDVVLRVRSGSYARCYNRRG
jgi:hypothetical protein